jgi:HEAT repeat protein
MKKEQVDILEKMWKKIDKNLTITAYTNLAIALMKATSRTKVISELTQHVSSKNVTLRTYALHTLGLIGDKESAKVFIDSYKDNNPEVRKSTVDAIGFLMDRHQINPLDKITADNIDLTLEIMNHLLPIPVW